MYVRHRSAHGDLEVIFSLESFGSIVKFIGERIQWRLWRVVTHTRDGLGDGMLIRASIIVHWRLLKY